MKTTIFYDSHPKENFVEGVETLLELSIIIAKKSRTFGKLLYDVTNSEQDYKTFNKVFLKKIPKIFLEFLF